MVDEIKTPEEITGKEPVKSNEPITKGEPSVEVKDGKVVLSESQYSNLVKMKDDMLVYKEKMRKSESDLESIKESQLKAKEEKMKEANEFKELYEAKEKELEKVKIESKNQKISNAISLAAVKLNIKKTDYVSLVKKDNIKIDDTTGEVMGVDDVMQKFKEDNPDLFGVESVPGVDTSRGSSNSGVLSDDEVLAFKGADLMRVKNEDPRLYDRWKKLKNLK